MTNVLSTYSFMDLLKDYNYVPEAEKSAIEFPENISALVEYFTDLIKSRTEDYDFMDLLSDNGYVPVNDNWTKPYTNDNNKDVQLAS
ncbi:MAG: hypothetical protein JKY84_04320 [Emcibacteraceae bacterium]|nr:hypothetical protein [Emcibacteraceae bacterium]